MVVAVVAVVVTLVIIVVVIAEIVIVVVILPVVTVITAVVVMAETVTDAVIAVPVNSSNISNLQCLLLTLKLPPENSSFLPPQRKSYRSYTLNITRLVRHNPAAMLSVRHALYTEDNAAATVLSVRYELRLTNQPSDVWELSEQLTPLHPITIYNNIRTSHSK
jgi:hypothetical protein